MSSPANSSTSSSATKSEKEKDSRTPDRSGGKIVEWEGGDKDPENPHSWSTAYKSWITLQMGLLALTASAGSSIISPANDVIAREFGISNEVSVLSISLYILGFAFGPLTWGPLSEAKGRRWSILPAIACLALFSLGTGFSKNAQSVFLTRFFAGFFGSAPVSNVSAALGDFWAPKQRGTAVVFYAICVVGGPSLSPVVGAAILVKFGWRWTEWAEAIFTFMVFVVALFCIPEVYAPVLLKRKAQRLRRETGDQSWYHPHEDLVLTPKTVITKHLTRPLKMLFTEPMVSCIAAYASFVYSILYLTLEVFPIVFIENRGYSTVVGTLPFLGLFVGVVCSAAINLGNQPRYARLVNENKGKSVPEARLLPMQVGSFLFCGGLFLFGWTAAPKYHWILPVIGATLIGCGFSVIFQQSINYLVDTYEVYAASAVSANTFLRSVLAAALPLVAMPMFHNLGTAPAVSILGGIAAAAIPMPFLFMKYGKRLRARSSFAPGEG